MSRPTTHAQRSLALLLLALLSPAAFGCGSSSSDDEQASPGGAGAGGAAGAASGGAAGSAAGGSGGAAGAAGAGGAAGAACEPAACSYGPLSPWREPLSDYLEQSKAVAEIDFAKLNKAIDDLMVHDDHLYFGYGDATLNIGRHVPIQIRSFHEPEDEQATVELPATDEEEIEHFRQLQGGLYIAGVDATEDAFLGNVFALPTGGAWSKHRSVPGGVHVHDITRHQGALYACGSGAFTIEEWNTGHVHSLLWRSTDEAQTWETVADVKNSTVGDRRWVQMVPFESGLMLFGYRTDSKGKIAEFLADRFDGQQVTASQALPDRFVLAAHPFTAEAALLTTVDKASGLRFSAVRIGNDGSAAAIEALSGKTVVDAHVIAPGKAVLLVADGDTYPRPDAPPPLSVLYTEDLSSFAELLPISLDVWPTAVAYWRRGVYVGLEDGRILRSTSP